MSLFVINSEKPVKEKLVKICYLVPTYSHTAFFRSII